MIEGAREAIASFNKAGIPVTVVTNQGGVAHGFHTMEDVEATHDHIASLLAEDGAHIDLFLYCPYHPAGPVRMFARHSEDRKPAPGMAIAAQRALGLALTDSYVIGDRWEDMDLAQAIGATGVYVGPGEPPGSSSISFPSLAAAAPFILEQIASA